MTPDPIFRIALANIPFPPTPDASISMAEQAIAEASQQGAQIICFPECFVPGYRATGQPVPEPDAAFLERAWSVVAAAAGRHNVAVVLGTERVTDHGRVISVLVINADGTRAGFQDKVQLDPTEGDMFVAARERRIFQCGPLTFGISICHEGFRYPETVRWAAVRGAQLVFHPHYSWAEPGAYRPTTFGDPANTFHEKSVLCRAAENTCFVASVNCAGEGSPTTSAVARPDGSLMCYQPYGQAGLLIADLDLSQATQLLARRLRT